MSAWLLRRSRGNPAAIFPLSIAASSRYFQTASGAPFPIWNFASWYVLSRSVAEYQAVIQDNISKGFTAVELKFIGHDPGSNNVPFAGNGAAPFLKTLSGANWAGSLTYSNINNDAPDFTTPNETYWAFVDGFIDYCAANGVMVLGFPSYVGFTTTQEGWRDEMAANGATKMQTYGAFIANRYKSKGNIIWMLLGDTDTGNGDFPTAAETALITGLKSVAGQASPWYCSEPSGGLATDDSTFGSAMNVNGAYAYFNYSFTSLAGYAHSPTLPMFFLEGTYEGNQQPQLDVAPMRRYGYWLQLSCIGGYSQSVYPMWRFSTGYTAYFNSAMRVDLARLHVFFKSVEWWRLIPESKGSFTSSIGTLITAGGGSQDDYNTQDMVTAAATSLGDLLIAYIGPGLGGGSVHPITIDMTKLRGTVTARWWDPTSGTYTVIGSFANTGTHVFTPPANHADTFSDWVLRLDA